jgi:UDPglucose--hexose-1-phosphate uridylyltransferase
MPELRTDWLTGRTVIIAENRANRPNEFARAVTHLGAASTAGRTNAAATSAQCPFCAGNESRTPPSVYEGSDEQGRWQVRVVPNMYPAVELAPADSMGQTAFGAHEVIIESARHTVRMSDLPVRELQTALDAYANRLTHWRHVGRLEYGLVFKNQGPQGGASLAHVHSQLIALGDVPPAVARELHQARQAFAGNHACPYCRLMEQEQTTGTRIVLTRDGYVAFTPYASLQPLEVWVMPLTHEPWFEQPTGIDARSRLAGVLHELLTKLEALIPGAAYNALLRTAPWQAEVAGCCHWRLELLPRFNALAGLELATGVHINPLSPEHAAERLRR